MSTSKITLLALQSNATSPTKATSQANSSAKREDYFPRCSMPLLAAVIALCAVLLISATRRHAYSDVWGQLNFGRWIAENGTLPDADPFAAANEAPEFVNLPWLSQLAMFGTYELAGVDGLWLANALLTTLGIGLLMLASLKRGVSLPFAVLAGLLAFITMISSVGAIRPQTFGLALLPLVLLAITSERLRWTTFCWLPLVFAAWANFDGSVAIGLLALLVNAVAAAWQLSRTDVTSVSSRGGILAAWALLLVCLAATCVNPAGPQVLQTMLSLAGNTTMSYLPQLGPLALMSLDGVLFLLSIAVAIAAVYFGKRPIQAVELILLIALGIGTCWSSRMLVWWAIVWPWAMAPHLFGVWKIRQLHQSAGTIHIEPAEPTHLRTLIAMAFIFATLLLAPPSNALLTNRLHADETLGPKDLPMFLADEIERRELTGNLFVPPQWADYLIWRTHGRVKPLVHSHVHQQNGTRWQEVLTISTADKAWLKAADRAGVQYLVTSNRDTPQLRRLTVGEHPRLRILYQDQKTSLVRLLPPAKPQAP